MRNNKIFIRLAFSSLAVACLLASCAAPATSSVLTNTPVPTTTGPTLPAPTANLPAVPTATNPPVAPTASLALTATTAPTALAPTVTTAPTSQGSAQVIPAINAFCRKGPGTGYYSLTSLQQGTAYAVIGRNSISTWWLVQASASIQCWMGDPNATKTGAVDQAPVVAVPLLPPAPASFSMSSYTCNSAKNVLEVSFTWSAVNDVSGYNIYQNGDILATFDPNTTTYHTEGPLKVDEVYELDAFNAYGMSDRLSVNVAGCNK